MKIKLEIFYLQEIGSILFAKRMELKITQDHLAKISGVSKANISSMENRDFKRINLGKLIALFEAMDIELKFVTAE